MIWVAGRGTAESGRRDARRRAGRRRPARPIVVAAEAPPWIGPLDVLVVAGDDPGDPALVAAAATAVHRGARVVVAAPYEGPLRDATAGRAAVLEPRLRVPDDFGLIRYLAAGLAALHVVDPGLRMRPRRARRRTRRRGVAQQRRSRVVHQPRQGACRPDVRAHVVLAGDCAADAGAGPPRRGDHAADRPPGGRGGRARRCARRAALGTGAQSEADREAALFHDDEIDGPLPQRARTVVLTLDAERPVVAARVTGLDDVDMVGVGRRSRRRRLAGAARASRAAAGDAGRAAGDGGGLPATGSRIGEWNLLRGALRTYAWGSRTAIAEFTGRPTPTAHPEAELWFGAHPGDPAWLETDTGEQSLLEAVRDRSRRVSWAPRCGSRFGDALPFLVKVLAADEPLSLQAHPSAEQARGGVRARGRLGIPLSSPIRNYRDRSHKPELLVALEAFEALAGFRPAPGQSR